MSGTGNTGDICRRYASARTVQNIPLQYNITCGTCRQTSVTLQRSPEHHSRLGTSHSKRCLRLAMAQAQSFQLLIPLGLARTHSFCPCYLGLSHISSWYPWGSGLARTQSLQLLLIVPLGLVRTQVISAPDTHGTGEESVISGISASDALGTGEDSVVPAPGTLGTG